MITNLLILIAGHFLGDYPLQGSYLAQMKGKSWYHLTVHVGIYTFTVWLTGKISMMFMETPSLSTLGVVFIFLSHFAIDAAKARWGLIKTESADQTLHLFALVVAAIL